MAGRLFESLDKIERHHLLALRRRYIHLKMTLDNKNRSGAYAYIRAEMSALKWAMQYICSDVDLESAKKEEEEVE